MITRKISRFFIQRKKTTHSLTLPASMQKKDTSNLVQYLANKKNFSRVLQEKYRATIATAVNMQKYPFYKSFLAKIIIFLEAEGAARPKTSFFLKRRGPLIPKRRFSWSGGVRSSQNVVFLEAEGSASFTKIIFNQATSSTRHCERPKGA